MDALASARVDWVGFVFASGSPRTITPGAAAALARHQPGLACVGLFVDPSDAEVAEVLDVLSLAVLQIHAPRARAAALRTRFGIPVWHAAGIATATDLPAGADGIDALLLDAKAPPGAPLPGGNARAFDWSVLRGWPAPCPWLLAGGLTPGTVADAIAQSGAVAVDVSSGVESSRGVKSAALIHEFVNAARVNGCAVPSNLAV